MNDEYLIDNFVNEIMKEGEKLSIEIEEAHKEEISYNDILDNLALSFNKRSFD